MTATLMGGQEVQTRERKCGCGAAFEQQGTGVPGTDRMIWHPLRCARCTQETEEWRGETRDRDRDRGVQYRALKALDALQVPPRYAEASLSGFKCHGSAEDQAKQARIRQLMTEYVAAFPDVGEQRELLVFSGISGSGKGHICWSVAKAVADRGLPVRFAKLAAIIRDLREAWRDEKGPSEDERLSTYRAPGLLIIDEMSRHAFYGREVKQHLYDIIDHRSDYRQPTIITTNEDQAGIQELLGAALVDRLEYSGGIIPFPAVSWRSRARDAQ